jgi:hypothetical protein
MQNEFFHNMGYFKYIIVKRKELEREKDDDQKTIVSDTSG